MRNMWILASLASVAVVSCALAMTPRGGAPAPGGAPGAAASRPANSPIAEAQVRLAGNMQFNEGATADKNGDIYFVDQNAKSILKWEFDKAGNDPLKGKLVTFLTPSGYSNGMSFDLDGNLIACADEKNELWSIAAPFPPQPEGAAFKPADLKITTLIKNYDPVGKKLNPAEGGKLLNGPNDVFVVPDGPAKGGMFITDPLWARQWWAGFRTNASQMPGNYVYFLSADRKNLTPVIIDMRTPNGVIGTPDGKTLYVSDMGGNQTHSYTINADGTLANKKLFCSTGSDGMTIDSDGNIYTTANNTRTGLQIWSKDGTKLDSIPVGCTNCCFGGKDGNILFICAVREIYGVKMKTHRVVAQ